MFSTMWGKIRFYFIRDKYKYSVEQQLCKSATQTSISQYFLSGKFLKVSFSTLCNNIQSILIIT
jgi:hypothetical protein